MRTKRRRTSKESAVNATEQCCALCRFSTNHPDQFGEMVTLEEHKLTVHYYCLLTASGLGQRGEEDEGIFGFLVDDIKQEISRSNRLRCVVCKRMGASVGCFVKSCRKTVHFPCGKTLQFISQFTDRFQSYCKDHSPTQSIPMSSDLSLPHSCSICLDAIEPVLSYSILKCPACHASWFHRDCVQHQAHSAGLFFFRCTLCNNKDSFQEEMLRMGVHIPERDASWELEENAFEDLLEVYQQCDALDCVCINGRSHPDKTGWFEVLRCALCGSRGTHRKCSGLNLDTSSWACEDCTEAVDGKASLVPRVSSQRGGQRRSLLSKRRLSAIHSAISCKRPSLSADSSPEEILQALALQLISPQPQGCPSPQTSPESSPQHRYPLSTLSRHPTQPQPSNQSHSQLQDGSTQPQIRISSLQHQRLISSHFLSCSSEPQPTPKPESQADPLPSQPVSPRLQPLFCKPEPHPASPLPSPRPQHSTQAPLQTRASRLRSRCVSQRLRQLQPQQPHPSPKPKTTQQPHPSPKPKTTQQPHSSPQLKTSTPQTHPSPRLQVQAPSSPVVVSGDQALSAGLTLVRRSNFNPTHCLSVRFKGGHKLPFPSCPDGIVAKSYFLKLLVQQIQESVVFEGPPGAKNLALDSQALREDLYFEVGCLLALSLVHGGPPLCFFSPALYQCLFNFPRDTPLSITHLTPSHFSQRINQIAEARSLEDLKKTLEACKECLELAGCNWPITTLEDKQALVEDLVSFTMITRLQLPLQRFREGLRTLGVFEQVQMFPAVFSRVFCGPAECLTAETLAGLFTVSFSERQDRQDRETPVVSFWRHLLMESEVGRSSISLQDILLFSTGGDMVPALGFQPPPNLAFSHPESPVQGRCRQGAGGLGEKDAGIDVRRPGEERSGAGRKDGRKDGECLREKRRGGLRRRGREASPPAEEGERDGGRDEEMEDGARDGCLEKGLFPQSQPGSNQLSLPVVSSYLAFKSSMELPISHCNIDL